MRIAVVRGSSHSANYKACGVLAHMEHSERIRWNTSRARLPTCKDMHEAELQCALHSALLSSSLYFFPDSPSSILFPRVSIGWFLFNSLKRAI